MFASMWQDVSPAKSDGSSFSELRELLINSKFIFKCHARPLQSDLYSAYKTNNFAKLGIPNSCVSQGMSSKHKSCVLDR